MAIVLKELVKFVENFGYRVTIKENLGGESIIEELLGAFEGVLPEDKSSTEYLKEFRETGYGKY